ncbi:MAG: lipopolysaccharide biosynthesis protein [candidate division WOR-3 bacterium]|nr:lipopolysaccharide biosynthesis protein [candidate division WOR-3 bacterium]
MSDSLRPKTLRGVSWSLLGRGGTSGIQLVISIILARLLLPAQFGLIAMISIFMAVAQSFVDSGFGSALIQKQDATRVDESSIFYFNIVVGFVAAGLLCLAAPWIAAFYKMPLLAPMTRALSLTLVINAFGLIQTSLMTKRVDFKKQMKVSTVAVAASGAIGILLAYLGFGVWSLVIQSLCSSLFQTSTLWLVYSWRPIWAFSLASLRGMFSYGSKLLLSGLLDTIYNNVYQLVIGKVYSPADLGFYSRAMAAQQVSAGNITGSVGQVTFPVFASIQDDKARLKRGVKEALKTVGLVTFPLMMGIAVCAKPLVRVLLTDKWLPAVPYLQLLAVVGMLSPLHAVNIQVLAAQGRSDLFFRVGLIKKCFFAAALAITYRWGIIAMICGQIVSSVAAYYLNSYYTGKLLKYPFAEQVLDLLPTLGLATGMGAAMHALALTPIRNQLILLALQIIAGTALYVLLCRLLRISSFMSTVEKIGPRVRAFLTARTIGA